MIKYEKQDTGPKDYKSKTKPKSKDKPKPKKYSVGNVKMNLINKSTLHHAVKKRMMNHAEHHTTKHLSFMIGKINNGKNFSESHMLAQKHLGK